MNDAEAIQMMERCVHDIQRLREERDRLAPLAEAYSVIRDVVALLPKQSQGYGEDILWVLKKRIQELQPKPKAESGE